VVDDVVEITPYPFTYSSEDINRCHKFIQGRPYPQDDKEFCISLHNENFPHHQFPIDLNIQTPDWSVFIDRIGHLKKMLEDYERKKTSWETKNNV
jgi:hypothetical protein